MVTPVFRTVAAAALAATSLWGFAGPAGADSSAQAIQRAQSHTIAGAGGGPSDRTLRPSPYAPSTAPYGGAAGPYPPTVPPGSTLLPVTPGPQVVMAPEGAVLHASPGPGSPVVGRLGTGSPVVVTRPMGESGWVEVLSGGSRGYVWSPQLTPQGYPPAPWGSDR